MLATMERIVCVWPRVRAVTASTAIAGVLNAWRYLTRNLQQVAIFADPLVERQAPCRVVDAIDAIKH